MAAHGDTRLCTEGRFFELDRQILAEIGTSLAPAAPATAASEHVSEAEELAKNVAEILENAGIETARPA